MGIGVNRCIHRSTATSGTASMTGGPGSPKRRQVSRMTPNPSSQSRQPSAVAATAATQSPTVTTALGGCRACFACSASVVVRRRPFVGSDLARGLPIVRGRGDRPSRVDDRFTKMITNCSGPGGPQRFVPVTGGVPALVGALGNARALYRPTQAVRRPLRGPHLLQVSTRATKIEPYDAANRTGSHCSRCVSGQ